MFLIYQSYPEMGATGLGKRWNTLTLGHSHLVIIECWDYTISLGYYPRMGV